MSATPRPWTVYRCEFVDKDGEHSQACGFNGQSVDWSYDECHHPLTRADADLIVRAVNAFDALLAVAKAATFCDEPSERFQALAYLTRRLDELDAAHPGWQKWE